MENRVALVTGGGRGIGLAIVRALQAQGIKVAVVGRSGLQPPNTMYICADLSQPIEVGRIIENVHKNFGRLDILVNNAGVQSVDWIESIATMLTAPYMLSYNASRIMENGSHIVNILSTAAFQGARNITPYVAAKHGLLGLTRAMAIEFAPKIHVNAIAPGLVETDMTKDITPERRALLESITPAGRFGKPEEVAEALLFLINSTNIYGTTIMCDGGWGVKNIG